MKKLITLFALCLIGIGAYGQKIANLGVTTTATDASRMLINANPANNTLTSITVANLATAVLGTGEDLADFVPLLTDTIPLVTFGAGAGLAADTALFNNGTLIGTFYNGGSDTLVVTSMMCVMKEGTGTETIGVQISWHATMLSGSATSINADAYTVTSLTTGNNDTAFANAKIPPGVFVWGILSGASKDNKPTFLSVTLSGYKLRGHGR